MISLTQKFSISNFQTKNEIKKEAKARPGFKHLNFYFWVKLYHSHNKEIISIVFRIFPKHFDF